MSQQLALHAATVAFSMVQVAKRITDEIKRANALIEGGSVFVDVVGDDSAFQEDGVGKIWAAAITGVSQEGLVKFANMQLRGATKNEETGCGICPECIAKGIKPPKGFKELLEVLMNLDGVKVHFVDINEMKGKPH